MSVSGENLRGIVAMVVCCFTFVFNDSLIKLASNGLPMGEIVFLRGLFGSALIAVLVVASGLHRSIPLLFHRSVYLRTVGELGSTATYLVALFHMPIAIATVIAQVAPLVVTGAGAVFFDEHVGWRRWAAIAIGFIGVLIVVRPGLGGLDFYALFALASVAFVAFRDLSTRAMPRHIPGLLAVAFAAAAAAVMGLVIGLGEHWVMPDAHHFMLLIGAAVFLMIGYYTIIIAMRHGELSAVAPFRYTVIPFAIVLGYLFWGDLPDWITLIGTVIIITTGIYTFYRERRLAKEPVISPGVPT